MSKFFPFIFVPLLALAACVPTPKDAKSKANTPSAPAMADSGEDHMMDDMEGDHMMMVTAALTEGCNTLKSKSAADKTKIIDEIGHNMDHDALDKILGKDCSFLGSTTKIADLTDPDLKLNPKDPEVLYFNATTNRFFTTCISLNTLAYVVERKDASVDPKKYFENNKAEFKAAAAMAKTMMEDMMMEGDMDMGDHTMEPEPEPKAAQAKGQYVAYAKGVVGNGEESVLFFHANWCPSCVSDDKKIVTWFPSGDYVNVYKVNYDTAQELKKRYGVTSQHTYVKIDGKGNVIKVMNGGTESALKSLFARA